MIGLSAKIDYSDKPIHTIDLDKKQIPHNIGSNFRGAKTEKAKYLSSGLNREHMTFTSKLPVLNRQADSNIKIKFCQDKYYQSEPRYAKQYKRLNSYETSYTGVNKADNNSKSGKLNVADSELTSRNVNTTLDSFTSSKKKIVRFNSQEHSDNNATQLPSRKFSQLVKLANKVAEK